MVLTRPLVVVDWNALQTKSRGAEFGGDAEWVLCDTVFREIVGKPNAVPMLEKTREWMLRNSSRLWLGRYWYDLAAWQKRTNRRVCASATVEPRLSIKLRRVAADTITDCNQILARTRGARALDLHSKWCAEFVRFCTAFADWAKANRRTVPTHPDDQCAWIRDPGLVTYLVRRDFDHFLRREWLGELAHFPDRQVVGRWCRLIAWYALKRAAGATRKFENNYDDAQYALLASCTGHLNTGDMGLIEAVRAVFPGVRIWQFTATPPALCDRTQTLLALPYSCAGSVGSGGEAPCGGGM